MGVDDGDGGAERLPVEFLLGDGQYPLGVAM